MTRTYRKTEPEKKIPDGTKMKVKAPKNMMIGGSSYTAGKTYTVEYGIGQMLIKNGFEGR